VKSLSQDNDLGKYHRNLIQTKNFDPNTSKLLQTTWKSEAQLAEGQFSLVPSGLGAITKQRLGKTLEIEKTKVNC
jgi:hypothetical protein